MHARTRPSPAGLATSIAVLALVVACGGAAAAAGLAKGSVTSRAIKNNAVKSADLKNGTVTTADLKDGTIGSVDVRNDGLSGTDIAESSLGVVPNATAVGGARVTTLSVSLPSGATEVPVLSEAGSTLSLDCGGSVVLTYGRTASGPPLVVSTITSPSSALTGSPAPGDNVSSNLADGHVTATIVLPAGGSVTAEFAALYEVNAAGTNDCFYRGTITRVP